MLKSMSQEESDAFNEPYWLLVVAKHLSGENKPMERYAKILRPVGIPL